MEWISVKDRLPNNGQQVLCFNGFRMMQNRYEEHTDQDSKWFKNVFTHWTYLPEPPKIEKVNS